MAAESSGDSHVDVVTKSSAQLREEPTIGALNVPGNVTGNASFSSTVMLGIK